jgi:phage shock protein C
MIAGVCGGLGKYLAIDPTLIRLLFVLITLLGGSGVLVYLIMMIVIPEQPAETPSEAPKAESDQGHD